MIFDYKIRIENIDGISGNAVGPNWRDRVDIAQVKHRSKLFFFLVADFADCLGLVQQHVFVSYEIIVVSGTFFDHNEKL